MSTVGQTSRSEVVVVGGGVIGLAAALALREAGREVLLLERDTVGSATSLGNCGTLTPSHALPLAAPGMVGRALKWMLAPDAPFYVKPTLDPSLWRWLWRFAGRCRAEVYRAAARPKAELLLASQALLAEWVARHGLDCQYRLNGLTYVYRNEAAFAAALTDVPLLASLGVAVTRLDGRQLEADEPVLRAGVAGGLHFPGDGHLRPDRYTASLARAFRGLGGRIEEGRPVQGMARESGGLALQTPQGPVRAREVVLAAGPWSPQLARTLGLRLPIQPGKGYSITYSVPERVPRCPLVLKERAVCVTAWSDGFRLGSTMEFAGYDASLNRRRLDALERGAREYLTHPVGPVRQKTWFGWRPMTWDDLPVIDRVPAWPGLWLAVGHGMMGVSMSAVTGRLLADLMTGREPVIDPSPCRLDRFS